MRIPFTQGVFKGAYSGGTKLYLEEGIGGNVHVAGADTALVAVIAHRDRNYLIEERSHVTNAWTGLPGATDSWLYWDVNIVTGAVTRGFTAYAPIVAAVAPGSGSPDPDQHWFDTATKTTFVWDESKAEWVEKIRVFAGVLESGTLLIPQNFESQASLNTEVEAGYILYNAGGNAIKDQTTRFVTTSSPLSVKLVSLGGVPDSEFPVNLDAAIQYAVASESIPEFSLVSPSTTNHVQLADFASSKFAIGMVINALSVDEDARVYSNGFITNSAWAFTAPDFGKTLYLGANGALTLTRPVGNPQIVGQVVWESTIQLGIKTDSTIIGPTGPTGAASTVTGPTGWTGPSVTGPTGFSGFSSASGFSGYSSSSGFSGYSSSVAGASGFSGYSGPAGAGTSGFSGYSGPVGTSGFSGYSSTIAGASGFSGYSGPSGAGTSGFSGYSGPSGAGTSGFSGYSSTSGFSGYSSTAAGASGFSGYSGPAGSTTAMVFDGGSSSTSYVGGPVFDAGHSV